MDFEKKYNEALEIAAQQLDYWNKRGVREKAAVHMAIEAIFPQLKESEDEKIRRELKEAFESYDIESAWNGIPIRSIFAWLEKQKEQKPSEVCYGPKGDPDPAGVWKPSREQMEALRAAYTVGNLQNIPFAHKPLIELYEQLKKLM